MEYSAIYTAAAIEPPFCLWRRKRCPPVRISLLEKCLNYRRLPNLAVEIRLVGSCQEDLRIKPTKWHYKMMLPITPHKICSAKLLHYLT